MKLDIADQRLYNQHLSQSDFSSPQEVVSHLGAVQAQDFAMAKWTLGLRMKKATDNSVEQAFNEGKILRTHVMRPTWHFVMPADIRWMLELTSTRVKTILAHYDRKLELDEKLITKSNVVITKALQGGHHLTRAELAEHLERNKISARGQRLGHIVSHAELDSIICSGPRRGRQFTYALLEERVRHGPGQEVKKLSRDESLASLALKYFTSHGPAQLKDFVWWSGLTVKDAQKGLDMVKSKLREESKDGKIYWFSHSQNTYDKSPLAYLMSIYDEYTIAYRDRSALGGERFAEKLLSMGNALTAVIILDGSIIGTWKRVFKKNAVEIVLNYLKKLKKSEIQLVSEAAARYGAFLGLPVTLSQQ